MGEVFLHVHQQTEVEAAVEIVLARAQLGIIDAAHYAVVGASSHIDAACSLYRHSLGGFRGGDVGAEASLAVAPRLRPHLNRVGGIAAAAEHVAGEATLVDHCVIHIERSRNTRLVVEQLAQGDVALVAVFELVDIFACGVVEFYHSAVEELHNARQRACCLRHRCEVVECATGNRSFCLPVGNAVAAVAHHLAMTRHQHLAAGESLLVEGIGNYRVDFSEHCAAHSHLLGSGVA